MTARKPVQLSYEALHRIRLATRGWPDLEIYDLGRQLSKAIGEYHSRLDLRHIKAQKVRLKKIYKTASKLTALLRGDEESGPLDWYSEWPKDLPPPSKVAEDIQRMTEESGVLETSPQKIIREIKGNNSAREWLVGTKLPEVFNHFFRRDVTLYLKGDYVRFALQVLAEFEIEKPKPSTIVRALTNASGASSRKHGGQK
jgi:hypothetical protein